jgi:hypothetical protein
MGLADIPGTSAGQAQQLKSPVATSSLGTSAGASSKQSQATQISVPALQPNGKQLLAGGSSAQRGNQANTTVQPQLFSSVNQAAQGNIVITETS